MIAEVMDISVRKSRGFESKYRIGFVIARFGTS